MESVATELAESLDKPFPWAVGFGMSHRVAVDGSGIVSNYRQNVQQGAAPPLGRSSLTRAQLSS